MNEIKSLTDLQRDALKEIGGIGAGNATTSLSRMTNKTVQTTLTDLEITPLIKATRLVKGEDLVVGSIQELKADTRGYILLLLSQESAKMLIKFILGEAEETSTFNEMEESVLKEIGNIMSGSYITALANFLGLSIGISPPAYIHDMAGAIINQIVCLMSEDVDYVVLLKTEFTVGSQKLDGKMIVFLNSLSLFKLLDAIDRIVRQCKEYQ